MKERQAFLLLFIAPMIWGVTFSFQRQVSETLSPFWFNCIRTFLGFLVLLPLTIRIIRKHDGEYIRKLIKGGILCGLCLATASAFQQFGMGDSTAGKGGFITSLYTLFVPILSVLLKKRVPLKIWFCVALAIFGAFLLCINGETGIQKGDWLLLACAFFFAVHIMVIDTVGKDLEGIDLTAVQFITASIINLILALITEPVTAADIWNSRIAILYSGLLSCGIAYTLQTVGQKYVAPNKATLVLSLESAWAAIGGAIILKETMNWKQIIGCALVFSAIVISQADFRKDRG